MVLIKKRLHKAHDKKKYTDQYRVDRSFDVGMKVFLHVRTHNSPIHYGKGSMLAHRFIVPFEILDHIGPLSYCLVFPTSLSHIHDVFHVSVLRRYITNPFHVLD